MDALMTIGQIKPLTDVVDDDARLQAELDSVVEYIRAECGWHIAPVITETVTLDGDGSNVVAVPSLRLLQVVSATVDGKDVPVTGLEVSTAGMIRGLPSSNRFGGIVLTIRHGYDVVPPVLIRAAASMVFTNLTVPYGLEREGIGSASIGYHVVDGSAGGFSPTDRDRSLLNPYRINMRP